MAKEILVEIGRKQAATIEYGGYKVVTKVANRYEGDYEVTPTTVPVVLETADRYLAENVVVKPIPKDWGHISFDGAVITVT